MAAADEDTAAAREKHEYTEINPGQMELELQSELQFIQKMSGMHASIPSWRWSAARRLMSGA